MAGMNVADIRVGGTGNVMVAVKDTAVPDIGTAWAAPWKDLGMTTQDGIKIDKKDKLENIEAWQYATPVRTVQSGREVTVKFTLIQVNLDTLPFFFAGDFNALPAPAAGASTRLDLPMSVTPPEFSLGVEFRDGGSTTRFYIPRAVVTANDEITVAANGAVKLGVTVTALASDQVPPLPLASWITK